MKTRNDILTALKTLTRADKEWLRDEIELQLASADEFKERALYLAFRRRLSIRMPYSGMLKSKYSNHVRGGLQAVLAFLDECELSDRDRGVAMLSVVEIISSFVQNNESDAFAHFPLHAIACAMKKVSGIIERSFPGYMEYGMIQLALCARPVRAAERQKEEEEERKDEADIRRHRRMSADNIVDF